MSQLPPSYKLRDSEYMSKFNFYKTKSSTGSHLIIDHKSGKGYVKLLLANDSLRKTAISTSTNNYLLGVNVPVVPHEFLVALKLKAFSSNPNRKMKDLSDITSILVKQGNKFNLNMIEKFLTKEELMLLKKYLED